MARIEKNNVDYFPHSVTHGKKMFVVRNQFSNDGYAVWFMLLEKLGAAHNHHLDLNDPVELLYLCSEFQVPEEKLLQIINLLVKLGEFNADLWNERTVLFNEKFVENIKDVYKRRNSNCITLTELMQTFKLEMKTSIPESEPDVNRNQQSKVNQSKVNQSKVNKLPKNKKGERAKQFTEFWDFYDKKIGLNNARSFWLDLTEEEIQTIAIHLPAYIAANPNKKFRANPENYLLNKVFNDEIIDHNPKKPEKEEKNTSGMDLLKEKAEKLLKNEE